MSHCAELPKMDGGARDTEFGTNIEGNYEATGAKQSSHFLIFSYIVAVKSAFAQSLFLVTINSCNIVSDIFGQ
jgi:hypothetical protein